MAISTALRSRVRAAAGRCDRIARRLCSGRERKDRWRRSWSSTAPAPLYPAWFSVFGCGGAASPAIGPGITGAWFDPAQSGHGLFIEVLNDNRFLAWWFAFNPAGTEQSWFGGVGTYSGNAATITDEYPAIGGRWIPNFDPSRIVNSAWGTRTIAFTDCNHGRVDFNSVAGYGTGSMNLVLMTQPAGLSCP